MGKLRVIVLSGFLGSGKTTFIKNVLHLAEDLRISIILNDVSEFDMDIDLVKGKSIQFKRVNDMIEMGGGCVCCTLKDDMIKEVKKIYKSKKYDYLFIEATGVSTPLPVAQAFNATEGIRKIVDIYSMITVIDAENFFINLSSDEIIKDE
jgi:G3E family GTPase